MSRRNDLRIAAAERTLHRRRRRHGRRSPEAGSAAAWYSRVLGDRITAETLQDAAATRNHWARDGMPWWMHLKLAFARIRYG